MRCSSSPATGRALLRGLGGEDAVVESLDTSGPRGAVRRADRVHRDARHVRARASASCTAWRSRASIAVAFTVLSALTLLPALLGFFGTPRAAPPRAPRARARAAPHQRRVGRRGRAGRAGCSSARRCSPRSRRRARACSRSRSCRCGSARPTRAQTRPTRPRARPTTCWPRASARATTARCSSSPRCRLAPSRGGVPARRRQRRRRDARGRRRRPSRTSSRARTAGPAWRSPTSTRRARRRTSPTADLLHTVRDRGGPGRRAGHRPARARRRPDGDLRRLQPRARRASCRCSSASSCCSASCC